VNRSNPKPSLKITRLLFGPTYCTRSPTVRPGPKCLDAWVLFDFEKIRQGMRVFFQFGDAVAVTTPSWTLIGLLVKMSSGREVLREGFGPEGFSEFKHDIEESRSIPAPRSERVASRSLHLHHTELASPVRLEPFRNLVLRKPTILLSCPGFYLPKSIRESWLARRFSPGCNECSDGLGNSP